MGGEALLRGVSLRLSANQTEYVPPSNDATVPPNIYPPVYANRHAETASEVIAAFPRQHRYTRCGLSGQSGRLNA